MLRRRRTTTTTTRATARAVVALALAAALSLTGCRQEPGGRTGEGADDRHPSASASSSGVGPSVILLPGNASPRDLVLAEDGKLWVAQGKISAIAEVAPSGKVTQHRLPRGPGFPPIPDDLQEAPDGAIWYTASDQFGRLGPAGKFTWWADGSGATGNGPRPDEGPGADEGPGSPAALTVGPDDTVWVAHSNFSTRAFSRADHKRGLSGIAELKGAFDILRGSVTLGSDGAVWFSQVRDRENADRDAIGRLDARGDHKQWPLPKGTNPQRTVVGPDEALWFTESGGIGRLDSAGDFSHFPVRKSQHPDGLVAGPDKAVWFTMGSRVGRVTTQGKVSLWRVPGARELVCIVPAPGGGFWLADQGTDTLRRFTPPG